MSGPDSSAQGRACWTKGQHFAACHTEKARDLGKASCLEDSGRDSRWKKAEWRSLRGASAGAARPVPVPRLQDPNLVAIDLL